MAATTAAIVGAAAAVGGTAVAAKGLSNANKAANAAANAKPPQVNIAETDALAREAARRNAEESAALEREFNPGAAELRQGSLAALLESLGSGDSSFIRSYAAGGPPAIGGAPALSAGNAELLARIQAQAGQPLTNAGFDSALTRQAVEQAAADLRLGGELPQDVRNLIARQALAKSGTVTGGLSLGRDLTARDLGLTSLDLRNQRLRTAAALGGQEAALEQANAAMRLGAEQYGRANLLQSQGALDAVDARNAQLAAQRDALASSNYFNQANLLQNIQSGDFGRLFQAAQLGQNIAQPQSGLDPSTIANLAVGNVNAQAGQQQQALALRSGAANAMTGFGSSLAGTGIGLAANFANRQPTVQPYTPFSSPYAPGGTGAFIASKNIFGP